MKLEDKVKDNIKSIESFIEMAEEKMSKNESFDIMENGKQDSISEYEWNHCGVRERYAGKLESLKKSYRNRNRWRRTDPTVLAQWFVSTRSKQINWIYY